MTLPPITAPYLASVALLGAAGVAKSIKPDATARALALARIPVGRQAVRVGAAAEVAIAAAAVLAPGAATASVVAGAYLAFTLFIVAARRRGWPLSSCGCFGRADTPPTRAHAVLDAAAAASALWWAGAWPSRGGFGRMARTFARQPWHGSALLFVSIVLAGLAYAVWTNPLVAARLEDRR